MAVKKNILVDRVKVTEPHGKAVNDWLKENGDVKIVSIQFVSMTGSVSVGAAMQLSHTFKSEGFVIHYRTSDPDKDR